LDKPAQRQNNPDLLFSAGFWLTIITGNQELYLTLRQRLKKQGISPRLDDAPFE